MALFYTRPDSLVMAIFFYTTLVMSVLLFIIKVIDPSALL